MGNSSRKKIIFLCIAILSVIGYGVLVFAAPPSGGYAPGAILDPECAPNAPDCQVALPTGGSSQWDDVLGGINYAGGNVGIGTTTPSAALDVVGTIQGSNLNITGNGVTVSAPTNLTASFIYDNGAGYNYSAYGYARNYRIYSYKDTVQGRAYSSSYLTLSMPVGSVPAAPTNFTANQTCADGCNYYADGSVTHNFRVYAYKTINDQRIYSTSYATLGSDFTDDNSNANYDITLSWDPVSGADGYRVLKYDQGYNGYNYDAGYDTVSTSIIDDGCGNVCFDSGRASAITTNDIYDNGSTDSYGVQLLWDPVPDADGYRIIIYDPAYNGYIYDAGYDTTSTSIIDDACGSICFDGNSSAIDVGQTTAYTNVATINGQLTLTGPIVLNNTTLTVKQNNFGWNTDVSNLSGNNNIFLGSDAGYGATNASYSNFLGYEAGQGATNAYNSNFLGSNAGQGATNASNSNFLGQNAGQNATNAYNSNFFGSNAGYGATNAYSSNFLGQNAGYYATSANNSNFLGQNAGQNATNAYYSNFLGYSAGSGATSAYNSNFIGRLAGQGATTAYASNFIGFGAGYLSTNAQQANFLGWSAGGEAPNTIFSNFMGREAGFSADNASSSNFLGAYAGRFADNAFNSNFFGNRAGHSATGAANANFIGANAGEGATSASYSNFFGSNAGYGATNAYSSNFLGYNSGYGATNAYNSNFLGPGAGYGATGAANANFIGANAGEGAANASNSTFIGKSAGNNDLVNNTGSPDDFSILIGNNTSTGGFSNSIALGGYATNTASNQFMIGSTTRPINSVFIGGNQGTASAVSTFFFGNGAGSNAVNASNSNFLGYSAGYNATDASGSNFFGPSAGQNAIYANHSNFFGVDAGNGATSAYYSNFLGSSAGYGALNAYGSNFFGKVAGYGATGASNSNFFGVSSGEGATGAYYSNFLGESAGSGSANAYNSNFFGQNAGRQSINASNSTFIGKNAGYNDLVNNTLDTDDFSILIGNNTSTGGFSNSIALGGSATNTASNQFMIGSTTRPITSMVLTGDYSGGSCTFAVGGMSCSSDERLKTNIEDLQSSTLDTVINIRTVHYNWNGSSDGPKQVGFIAQDLQQYFPELVSMGQGGYLQVNYAQMTPILVQAIREMNLNIVEIANTERPNTWRDSLIAWFGNVENGITDFFAKRVRTDELCVGTVCVTEDQFMQMVQQSGQIPVVQTLSPDPQPANTPTEDTSSDQPVIDTVSPSDTPAPTENTDIETSNTSPSDSSSDTPLDSGINTETVL